MGDLTMEQRVERLERQNRRLRLGMLAVIAVVVGLICFAATNPVAEVVRARRFEVVNPQGRHCAVLGTGAYGTELTLCDKDATTGRAILSVPNNGASVLTLTDKRGAERVTLAAPGEGRPMLLFREKDGQTVFWKAP